MNWPCKATTQVKQFCQYRNTAKVKMSQSESTVLYLLAARWPNS